MYHGIVLLLEPDETLRSDLMDCLHEWSWAVYPLTDVASAIDALAHPLVRWCLLHIADHSSHVDTLAHLHAALRPEQRVLVAMAGDPAGSLAELSSPQMTWVAAPLTRTVLEQMLEPRGRAAPDPTDDDERADQGAGPRLKIDLTRRRAWVGQREIRLSRLEARLLSYLARYNGMVCSYRDLAEHLYHRRDSDLRRVVQARMQYLRRKLEPDPQQTRYVHTIRGIGYRLTMTPIASDGSPEMRRKLQRAVLIKGC